MVEYEAPLRDYDFLFNEVFDVTPTIQRLGYDFDEDFLSMLAEGWADHAKEVWLPINQLGDRVGLKFECPKNSRMPTNRVLREDGFPRPPSQNMEEWGPLSSSSP